MGCTISCYCVGNWDRKLREAEEQADFSLKGITFKAKVVKVIDGRTCRVVFRRRGELLQYTVSISYFMLCVFVLIVQTLLRLSSSANIACSIGPAVRMQDSSATAFR